ncbi:LysR family transcriptional regulator [Amycolatopsis regifaucium]|uniref:LysR family transcriptional regulator n=1 Tax=Amycolatopsis regifaucium TaxID=546365 RepID=A0A154M8N7_9PSEU|nr:LysR family transcriptional regulator [Amycolatopsis regifaucium]KZB81008.1 LysR family transcriptional regulator [Amycolatopsis regifaucium]OKA11363.1 LysR family transcriptional regulator [Amycolatopsis regifaucium]SFH43723.1 DNA-binding transcriptional regulator, LysR family [Amycolatopsis regifaucium]
MDARQLRYFLAVVDAGSVHRAAERLYVAQPSVSQALRALERDLGSLLFHRTGRRLVLTAAGHALVPPAREVMRGLDLARATVEAVDGLLGGELIIASMPSQSVSPLAGLIAAFAAVNPLVRISVRAASTPADVGRMLTTGDAELGVVAVSPSTTALPGLAALHLETQRFAVLGRDEAALPSGDPVRPADLAGAALIVGQPGTGMRAVADAVRSAATGSRFVVEVEHREAVLPLVLAGVGIAVVSDSWRALARAAGAAVRALDRADSLEVSLVSRPGRLSPAAAAFHRLADAKAADAG